jgi:hypothetical protein
MQSLCNTSNRVCVRANREAPIPINLAYLGAMRSLATSVASQDLTWQSVGNQPSYKSALSSLKQLISEHLTDYMYLCKSYLNFLPFFCGLRIRKAEKDPTCTEDPSCNPPAEVQHTDQLSKVLELTLHRVTHLLLPDSAPSQDGGGLQVYSAKWPSEC